ncbi:MAG TPA: VOC family protein [Dehalococcoidia bacterium]
MQKVHPFLWFDSQAEEAASLYTSLFPDGRVIEVNRYGPGAPMPEGSVMSVTFEIGGVEFMALNAGPVFKLNEAFSIYVHCQDQAEVDYYWDLLLAGGGEPSQCGWLKDRFGLSWQIVPEALGRMLGDSDRDKAGRVMQAMLQMSKIDVAGLERARDAA